MLGSGLSKNYHVALCGLSIWKGELIITEFIIFRSKIFLTTIQDTATNVNITITNSTRIEKGKKKSKKQLTHPNTTDM